MGYLKRKAENSQAEVERLEAKLSDLDKLLQQVKQAFKEEDSHKKIKSLNEWEHQLHKDISNTQNDLYIAIAKNTLAYYAECGCVIEFIKQWKTSLRCLHIDRITSQINMIQREQYIKQHLNKLIEEAEEETKKEEK